MKNRKNVLWLAIIVMAIISACSRQYNAERDFLVERKENGITIIGYTGSKTVVNIPPTIQNLPVTSIGVMAFESYTRLTSITIPDSVTDIGIEAFAKCTSLTSITIPDNVTSIKEMTFALCTNLTNVTISNSVIGIGEWAFAFCESLTSITIPDSITSIEDNAFTGCASLNSITIPNSITSIGKSAFAFCKSLTSVTIGNRVINEQNEPELFNDGSTTKYLPFVEETGTPGYEMFYGPYREPWFNPEPIPEFLDR